MRIILTSSYSLLESLARISGCPPDLEIIASSLTQNGSILEALFELGQLTYRFICPDFQRLPKEHQSFENVRCHLFIVDIATKNRPRTRDGSADCLEESLTNFTGMMSLLGPDDDVLLLLDGMDQFRQELINVPLAHHFPDYNGRDDDFVEARSYVKNLFINPHQGGNRTIRTHFVELGNKSDFNCFEVVIASIQDIIIMGSIVKWKLNNNDSNSPRPIQPDP